MPYRSPNDDGNVEKWHQYNDSQLIFFLTNSYDFRNPGFKSGTGHFTQIVWQETKELGMAKVKSSDGKIIVVARYRPPGNVINHFQENVNPKVNTILSFRSDSFYWQCRDIVKRSMTAILGRSSCCLVRQRNSLSVNLIHSVTILRSWNQHCSRYGGCKYHYAVLLPD